MAVLDKSKCIAYGTLLVYDSVVMWGKYVFLYPLSVVIGVPLTFIISYSISVSLEHVEAGFPYISDTGTLPPESCIFGQLLNICAVLAGITIYLRYRQVYEALNLYEPIVHQSSRLHRINTATLVLGLMPALGLSVVGNFQESNVLSVHLLGAFMVFGIAPIYAGLQSYMSYKVVAIPTKRVIKHLRVVISVFIAAFFIVTVVASPLSFAKYTGNSTMPWTEDDGGFAEHLTATIAEWSASFCIMLYFLAFIGDFRKFGLRSPEFYVHYGNDPDERSKLHEEQEPYYGSTAILS